MSAVGAFGLPNPENPVTKEAFDAALIKAGFGGTMRLPSGANATGVGPEQLEEWYAERIQTEGRWRTFARINSDSGHACSSTLHAKALGSTYDQVWRYFFDYVKNGSLIREFASPSCCASKQATQPRNETGRQPACSQCLS
jgi:hypothetical protein